MIRARSLLGLEKDSHGVYITCYRLTLLTFPNSFSIVLPFHGYVNQEETSKKIGDDILEKGNSYFLSGDLLVKDEYGYVYFYDRIGDTFR